MFNGPRAGVNFLDGFGGGNNIKGNLLFNWVRETGDHGPFNSWDRMPYLTTVQTGEPSVIPATTNITRNFIINSYDSTWPLDHDDGSSFYEDTYNFLVYGGYKNYLGNSKNVHDNIYVLPDSRSSGGGQCVEDVGVGENSGWGEQWYNNTCICAGPNAGVYSSADDHKLAAGGNVYMTKSGNVTMQVGSVEEIELEEAQKTLGFDLGSAIEEFPSNNEIIKMGRDMLF